MWQFGDNQSLGELGTLSFSVTCPGGSGCHGAQVSHTFPGRGTYPVALTVQAADCRSWGFVKSIGIYAPLVPQLSATGSFLAGNPVDFNATATMHDLNLRITSYSWNFGDGATATGPRLSHIHASAGTYVLTLTVTDSAGERVSRSRGSRSHGPATSRASSAARS